jgi:hypothetical protein
MVRGRNRARTETTVKLPLSRKGGTRSLGVNPSWTERKS